MVQGLPMRKKNSFPRMADVNTMENGGTFKTRKSSSASTTIMNYQDPSRMGRMGQQPAGRFTGPPITQRGYSDPGMAFPPGPGGGQRAFVSATLPRGGFAGPNRRNNAPADPFMEVERMKRMVGVLQEQLTLADDTIRKMKSGQQSQDLQTGVAMSGRFENISQGGTRPSQIIEQYGQLYSQGRLNAMDDLDQIAGLSKYGKHTEMKQKILYGIMVASYKVSYEYLTKLKTNLRRLMGIPEKHSPAERDAHGEALGFLMSYFQSTTQSFDLEPVIQDVQDQLIQLLPEFPSLSRLPGIASYSADCCRVAWSMVNHIPPMELEHSLEKFTEATHTRFHASSEKHSKVKMYVWPTLLDTGSKATLFKGVVWT